MYRTLREPIVAYDEFDELVIENDEKFDPCRVLQLGTDLDLLSKIRTWDASERTNFRGCWKTVVTHVRNGQSDWKEGVETLYSLIEKKDVIMDPYELLVPYEGSSMEALTYAMKLQPNPNELGTVKLLHALILYSDQQDDEVKDILWAEKF